MAENPLHLENVEVIKNKDVYRTLFRFRLTYTYKNPDDGSIWEYVYDTDNPFCQDPFLQAFTVDPFKGGYWLCLNDMKVFCREVSRGMISPPHEPIEVTMDEVEKKFGRHVKIVKEKTDEYKTGKDGDV